MKRRYFNTGVKYSDYPSLYKNQVVRGGVKQIPFDVPDDVPDSAELLFLCGFPDLPASQRKNVMVVPILNSDIGSEYAYFRLTEE
jgi:hypothetical protein